MKKALIAFIFLFLSNTAFAEENPRIHIETTMGNIELELYPSKAPITVKNFLRYINEGHFTDTIFHRVIKNFMIQGGGFSKTYNRKPSHKPIQNEAFNGLRNDRGTIAMARTSMPHSATAQFFINTGNNLSLNFTSQTSRGWGYTVFGKVIAGMKTVDSIENMRTGPGGVFPTDVPQTQVVITKIEVIKK
jgi:peptidyl-prolyl cis-trans isomerase A (cyclophilin A)/peptidyl-prolyl cis-trans isomerase B (cyclophilin B)